MEFVVLLVDLVHCGGCSCFAFLPSQVASRLIFSLSPSFSEAATALQHHAGKHNEDKSLESDGCRDSIWLCLKQCIVVLHATHDDIL